MLGSRHRPYALGLIAGLALAMGACADLQSKLGSFGTNEPPPPPSAPAVAALPPAFPPEDIVGRWGFASFHKEGDRPRTEKSAKAQCNKPYVINRGPTDHDEFSEVTLRLEGDVSDIFPPAVASALGRPSLSSSTM